MFITSKIPCSEHSHRFPNPMTKAAATKFLTDDLEQMGLTYIDLMLVHWPCVTAAETAAVWSAMEDMLESKQLRALGVSNFKQADIEALAASATVQPAVNQCSMAAGKTDDATLAYCQAHNITYEACERNRSLPSSLTLCGGGSGANALASFWQRAMLGLGRDRAGQLSA